MSFSFQTCTELSNRVNFTGDYNEHECEIVVTNLSEEDEGNGR